MDRAEAEAIYDSGREACVEFIVDLANRFAQHEDRLSRLEAQARQDSRTSSRPPSMDPPKSRAERRAEARAKAKELMRREGEPRKPGGQSGQRGAGRELRAGGQIHGNGDAFPGAVDQVCQRASDALAGPHCQLQDWVLDQRAVHVDETGWRTSGEGRALWTASTPGATFLQIAEHCNRQQFTTLIGSTYSGIVVS